MLIERCTYKEFEVSLENLASEGKLQRSNQVVDLEIIKKAINNKCCLLSIMQGSVVLMVPEFSFYNLYLFFYNLESLRSNLQFIKNHCSTSLPCNFLKISLCGKELVEQDPLFSMISAEGFLVRKKIARFIPNRDKKLINREFLNSLVPEQYRNVEYSVESDAEEILELLRTEFDDIGDSIPEIEEIRENIRKQQVVCVKYNGMIISFHYFKIVNNIYFGLFDYARPEFRKNFVFCAIQFFCAQDEFLNKHKFKRLYGWRDVLNKRTTSFAIKNGDIRDGVFVWNMACSVFSKS